VLLVIFGVPSIYDTIFMYFLFNRSLFVLCRNLINTIFAVKKNCEGGSISFFLHMREYIINL
jgi:hypothetical protein